MMPIISDVGMPVNAFKIQVVRVADRGEHAAHVRADGHQRADKAPHASSMCAIVNTAIANGTR